MGAHNHVNKNNGCLFFSEMSSKRKSQPTRIMEDPFQLVNQRLKEDPKDDWSDHAEDSPVEDMDDKPTEEPQSPGLDLAQLEYLRVAAAAAQAAQGSQLAAYRELLQRHQQNQRKSMEDVLKKLAAKSNDVKSPQQTEKENRYVDWHTVL